MRTGLAVTTFLALLAFLLFFSPSAFAGQIKLAWDPPTTSVDGNPANPAGYMIYYGTSSGTYGTPIDVGNVTEYTLDGLTEWQTYFIAVTAYDTLHNESGYSAEVSGIPSSSDPLGISLGPTSAGQIKLVWNPLTGADGTPLTDVAGYKIYWGTSPGTYTNSVDVGNVRTYTLDGLAEGQIYFIGITAYDTLHSQSAYSNEVVGVNLTVVTNPPGLQVMADSVAYTTPRTFFWAAGSSHLLSLTSPQTGAEGTRYVYASWSDGGSQGHTITVSPSTVKYTANFSAQYSLTTQVNPSGGGLVSPSGTNWYGSGGTVPVSANANAGYSFSNWTGDLVGSSNTASLTMNGPKTVTANFSQNHYSLTVNMSPSEVGSVSKNPDKATYVYGDRVQLTAKANPGYTFSGWSGGASGTASPITVTMDGSKAVTAIFTQDQYTLAINLGPSGVGVVSRSPDKATYVYGDQVQLTAVGNPGYTFSGWSGDASGTASSITITMNGDKTVTAKFLYSSQVSLKAGYNLVSFPTIVGQTAITDLLSSISGEYKAVYAYEGCDAVDPWKIYDPTLPPAANDLQYVDSAMGIWIEVQKDAELTAQGLFSAGFSIPLCAGWNLISYAGEQAKPVAEALSSISGKYEKVYSYRADDVADPWKIYDVSVPAYVNGSGDHGAGIRLLGLYQRKLRSGGKQLRIIRH